MKYMNILRNATKRSNYLIMANKLFNKRERNTESVATAWAESHTTDYNRYVQSIDPALAEESTLFAKRLSIQSKIKLKNMPYSVGGGSFNQLLYFFARLKKPATLLETGVAAGSSTQTLLSTIELNGMGKLYSSDFPYCKYPNPESLVGYLVDDHLKENWELSIEGDRIALPAFLARLGQIDFFHYDSDKSYAGRTFAFEQVLPRMSKNSTIIMDDIQDNVFFRDWVESTQQTYFVFNSHAKYIGIVPNFAGTSLN